MSTTIVYKEMQFLDGSTGPVAFMYDGTNYYPITTIVDNTGAIIVDASGLPVTAAALPLPSGAATAALQPAINGDGGALAHVTNFPATQTVTGTVNVQAGSTGTDYSPNKPALPNVGANFPNSGPFANYVLLETMPANPNRALFEISNTSGAQCVFITDDGTAASGAQPANASLDILGGGPSAFTQGGAYSSNTFKGRVQLYALTSSNYIKMKQD